MKNFITGAFILLLVLMGANAFGQASSIRANVEFKTFYLDGGIAWSMAPTAMDSIGTYYSNKIDISAVDFKGTNTVVDSSTNRIQFNWNYVTPGGTGDTVLATIYGMYPGWTESSTGHSMDSLWENLGTITLIGSLGDAIQSVVWAPTNGYRAPYIRVKLAPTRADTPATRDGYLALCIYTPNMDYMPPFKQWGQKY